MHHPLEASQRYDLYSGMQTNRVSRLQRAKGVWIRGRPGCWWQGMGLEEMMARLWGRFRGDYLPPRGEEE
ncbi:MAG: hypothetical protein RAO92_02385 [Candidatus Euphemobacter frigidus]|nr:hypothetical protein [Candidatus Euphemobacter frigidus]MDP8275231.1 hypothetical protein [Candidatus Euphemobacter frigidus]